MPPIWDGVVLRLVEGLHCTISKKVCLIWMGAIRQVYHVLKERDIQPEGQLLTAGKYAALCDVKRHQAVDASISWLTARRAPRCTTEEPKAAKSKLKHCNVSDTDTASSSTESINSSPQRSSDEVDNPPPPKIVVPHLEAGGSAKLNGFLVSTFDGEDAWKITGHVQCTDAFKQICSRSHNELCEKLCQLDFDIAVAKQHAQLLERIQGQLPDDSPESIERLVRVVKNKEVHSLDHTIFLTSSDSTLYCTTSSRIRFGTHLLNTRPSWIEKRVRFGDSAWISRGMIDWETAFGKDGRSGTHGSHLTLQLWEIERSVLVYDVEQLVTMMYAEDKSTIHTDLQFLDGVLQSSPARQEMMRQQTMRWRRGLFRACRSSSPLPGRRPFRAERIPSLRRSILTSGRVLSWKF